jgi:hypothetical protein
MTIWEEPRTRHKLMNGKLFLMNTDSEKDSNEIIVSERYCTALVMTVDGKCTVESLDQIVDLQNWTQQPHHYYYKEQAVNNSHANGQPKLDSIHPKRNRSESPSRNGLESPKAKTTPKIYKKTKVVKQLDDDSDEEKR